MYCLLFQEFENIESEWPMFFAYMVIDSKY